jgi:HK97 family phage prohead protease
MSAAETPETGERIKLFRSFELPLADAWDGRTLDTRIVPYNLPATVADPPHFRPYREAFVPGAFERQLTTPGRDRVWLNVEHEPGFRGAIGRSLRFEDHEDGLHGSFGVLENADGDKALELIRDGFLTGLSLEFDALNSRRVNGVVHRVRAQLDKVSLCRYPAYPNALVLAMREEPEEPEEPELEPLPDLSRSSDVDERLAAVGFEPLMRADTTSKAWDGSAARFTDEQYQRSTLFCRPGDGPPKERCSLPVLEPDGTLNVNALGAAAAALSGGRTPLANVTAAIKATAARKLIRYYNQAGMEPPQGLRQLAGSA